MSRHSKLRVFAGISPKMTLKYGGQMKFKPMYSKNDHIMYNSE